MNYIILEMRITRGQGPRSYLVSSSASIPRNPVNHAQAAFTIPSDIEHRLHQILVDSQLRETKILQGLATRAKNFGIELFNYLFQSEVKQLYHEIKARAVKHQLVVRLRLQIVPAELSTLPWELLHDSERYLCLSNHPKILFARVPDAIARRRALNYDPPLRLLGIAACPDENNALNIEKEITYINTALDGLIEEQRVEIEWKRAEPSVLINLKFGDPWHILHFIGHGHFDDKETHEGQLVFEDAKGKQFDFDANRLSLSLHKNIQLVFLNACDTARGDPLDYLSSFAYRLAISGIPAIVVMQFKISDEAAIEFSRIFYKRIARGDAVDEAVTEARHHIYVSGANSLEWIAPILYISTANYVLFKDIATVSLARKSGDLILPNGTSIDIPQSGQLPNLDPSGELTQPMSRLSFKMKVVVIIVVIFCLLFSSIFFYVFNSKEPVAPSPPPGMGIGVYKAPNGDWIGISDGNYSFDIDRPSGPYKSDAAKKLLEGNTGKAVALWQAATLQDPRDAEAKIYLENQWILDSGNPYINIVLGVAMADDSLYTSRDVLQGAYIAQKMHNEAHNIKVRLLIASSGNEPLYTRTIAQQVAQLLKIDSHTMAVMGWTHSSGTLNALPILTEAHLVMLSQHASSGLLADRPYFFRIVPPNKVQAEVGAIYAKEKLKVQNIAVFVDPTDPYSIDLKADFASKFENIGGKIVATEVYKLGQTTEFKTLLDDALQSNPDLIYFAGHASDISAFLAPLPTTGKFAALRVMAGGAGGGVVSIKPTAGYHRLLYTSFAHSDAWKVTGVAQPPFMDGYSKEFSANNKPTGDSYTIPSEYAIVSYDAVVTLLTGYQIALQTGKATITPDDLRSALTQIKDSKAIQGVSGQIAFDAKHNPINKPVFIVEVKQDGTSHIVPDGIQGGCYIKGCQGD